MKNWILTILKFGISIAILTWLIRKDWHLVEQLGSVDKRWSWFVSGCLFCLIAHVLGFIRWRLLVRALNLPINMMDAIRIGFIGNFFGLFAFGVIGGDSVRAYYVTRHAPDRKPEAISSVFADRFIGLVTMFGVAAFCYLLFGLPLNDAFHPDKVAVIKLLCQITVVVSACSFAFISALFFAPGLAKTSLYQRIAKISKIGPIVTKVTSVILEYRSRPIVLLGCFLLSLGVNICFAISIYSIAFSVSTEFPTFANHFLIEPIAMVANAVPLPGGVGGMEFALDFLYRGFSNPTNPSESGTVVALLFRFSILLLAVIGACFWFTNKSKMTPPSDEVSDDDLKKETT